MSGAPIAIIGGGVFAVPLCRALAEALPPAEIRLMARRYDRLCTIAAECQRAVDRTGEGWRVHAARSVTDGCAGAGAIVLLLRQGGLAARARDESFPRAFGLAGDEGLGPGGMANALRTIPALRTVAEAIVGVAPDAWILNMVAPLGVTTRLLLDSGLRTVGVCELPAVTERRLREAACLDNVRLQYGGFNHWGWFWTDGENSAGLARAALAAGLADPEIAAAFGAVPLRYFYEIFFPGVAERLGFRRPLSRAADLGALSERIFASFPMRTADSFALFDERPTPWFREALVPVLAALTAGAACEGFVNVRNECRLPMVPKDTVVEVRARFSADGIETLEGSEPPAAVASFRAAAGLS